MSNKKFNFIYLMLAIQLVLSSCVPKDEFLPDDTMKLGATGLREKTLEEQQIEKEKRAAEREKINNINDRIFEDVVSTAVDVSDAPIVITSVDQVFAESLRKVMYVTNSGEVEATINPSTFIRMKYILGGQFLVGDQVIFYPDRDCEVSPLRNVWKSPMEKEVDATLYLEAIAATESTGLFLPGNIDIELSFDVFPNEIADGEFHPTMRYVRNGNISSCYSFMERSQNLFKDTTTPKKPGTIKILNPVSSDQFALVEVYGNIEPGYTVELFQGPSCSGSSLTKKISTSGLARFKYLFTDGETRNILSGPGSSTEFDFSSRFVDLAGNVGECSNKTTFTWQFPANLEKITIEEIPNDVIKVGQNGVDYIGDINNISLNADTYFDGDQIVFYRGDSCTGGILSTLENTTGSDGLHTLTIANVSCTDILATDNKCTFSAKKIAADGKESCSPSIVYYLDTEGPTFDVVHDDRLPQVIEDGEYVISSIENGFFLEVANDAFKDYFTAIGDLKFKLHLYDNDASCANAAAVTTENELDSTFQRLHFSTESILGTLPTEAAILENHFLKLEDPLGNKTGCLEIPKMAFESEEVKLRGFQGSYHESNHDAKYEDFGFAVAGKVDIKSYIDQMPFSKSENTGFFFQPKYPTNNLSEFFSFEADKMSFTPWNVRFFEGSRCASEVGAQSLEGFSFINFGDPRVTERFNVSIHGDSIFVGAFDFISQQKSPEFLKSIEPGVISMLVTNSFERRACVIIQSPNNLVTDNLTNDVMLSFDYSISERDGTCNLSVNGNERQLEEPIAFKRDMSTCNSITLNIQGINFFNLAGDPITQDLETLYSLVVYEYDGSKGITCYKYHEDPTSDIRGFSSSYLMGQAPSAFTVDWFTTTQFGDDYSTYNKGYSTELEIPITLDTANSNLEYIGCPLNMIIPKEMQAEGFILDIQAN